MNYELISPRDETLTEIEQILINRGIKEEEIFHFKHPTEGDLINPLLLDNIEQGAKMLIKHISLNNKIFIQVDADCDGYTSASLLINYLNALFPHYVQTKIIYRTHDEKAHGLLLDTIPEDVKLVIAPDASSSDFEIHKKLKAKGIEVLIIDHHEAEKISEDACIINN